MSMAVGNDLTAVGLVFLCLALETLKDLSLAPVASTKLQRFSANEVIVPLAAVLEVNDLGHSLDPASPSSVTTIALVNAHLPFFISHLSLVICR